VNGCTAKNPEIKPSLEISADYCPAADGLDIPDSLLRPPPGATCAYCDEAGGVLKPERTNGRLEWLHPRCVQYRRRRADLASKRAAAARKRTSEQ